MQLVNQIIYGNIYSDPAEGNAETCKQPQASQNLREGVLLLHRGGLASFKWVKYACVLIDLELPHSYTSNKREMYLCLYLFHIGKLTKLKKLVNVL